VALEEQEELILGMKATKNQSQQVQYITKKLEQSIV
jgi:hypothetical protein